MKTKEFFHWLGGYSVFGFNIENIYQKSCTHYTSRPTLRMRWTNFLFYFKQMNDKFFPKNKKIKEKSIYWLNSYLISIFFWKRIFHNTCEIYSFVFTFFSKIKQMHDDNEKKLRTVTGSIIVILLLNYDKKIIIWVATRENNFGFF